MDSQQTRLGEGFWHDPSPDLVAELPRSPLPQGERAHHAASNSESPRLRERSLAQARKIETINFAEQFHECARALRK
jgi:hypothetical protein